MRKQTTILTLALLLATGGMQAQTEVLTGVTRGKDYGVTYILPKTAIELHLTVTRHSYTPGELCRYAARFMKLTDVETNQREYWTLDKVETTAVGLPDRDKTYFVKLKDKSTAPLMELTEEGIVRSINLPYSGGQPKNDTNRQASAQPDRTPDPSAFMTEEMLMANSTAKMAELVAKEIYLIRESKNALTRGEADFMPQDGAQLKLMLDNLNMQEKALMSLFTGQEEQETKTVTLRVEPREVENEMAFRFSKKRGLVDKDDLSGEPAYLSIADLHTVNLPPVTEEETKKLEGVAYNVPGKARVTLEYEHTQLYDGEVSVTQFGCTEYLAPVLFNKSATTQVLFDTVTGGLLKVDRGE